VIVIFGLFIYVVLCVVLNVRMSFLPFPYAEMQARRHQGHSDRRSGRTPRSTMRPTYPGPVLWCEIHSGITPEIGPQFHAIGPRWSRAFTVSGRALPTVHTLFTVSVTGQPGNHTVYTVDAEIFPDNIDTSGGISSMNFSQETVSGLSSVRRTTSYLSNSDLRAAARINIVTRSRCTTFHGSGYFFSAITNMACIVRILHGIRRYRILSLPAVIPGSGLAGPIRRTNCLLLSTTITRNRWQSLSKSAFHNALLSKPFDGPHRSPFTRQRVVQRKLTPYRFNAKKQHVCFPLTRMTENAGFAQRWNLEIPQLAAQP